MSNISSNRYRGDESFDIPRLVVAVASTGPVLCLVSDDEAWGLAFQQRHAIWWFLAFGDPRDLLALEGCAIRVVGGAQIPLLTDPDALVRMVAGADDAKW